jgi:hypothetical protein
MIARYEFTGGEQGQAMSIRELRDRLTEIIEENDAHRRSHRNDLPIMIETPLARTPSGRLRHSEWAPLQYAHSSMMGLIGWNYKSLGRDSGVMVLETGPMLAQPSRKRVLR